MILVLVGTERGFDRLIREVDRLAAADLLPEETFCQIGAGDYEPSAVPFERMLSFQETQRRTREASVVVSHGGPGCILPALAGGRPLVAVPRLGRLGEAVDDHQVAFCRHLAGEPSVEVVEDVRSVGAAMSRVHALGPSTPRISRRGEALRRLNAEVAVRIAEHDDRRRVA